ncbi:MAG: 1-acyl-sn-glycerol-3-phosphate acyltransferase [Bacteroidia bacterium]|nr:1-acyl-sn-glycerol-3-phosphate acyltransferase [Bacteroidia bacterium]
MLILAIYRFFQKHKFLLLGIVVALLGVFAWFGSKVQVEEDITKFIPRDKKTDEINLTLKNMKIRDKLVIHIYHTDNKSEDPTDLMKAADLIADSLLQTQTGFIKELNYKVSDALMMETYETFYKNLPIFLEETDYQKISNLIKPDSVEATLKSDYKTLMSPSGMVLGKFIRRDPLNLTPLALKKVQSLQFDENFAVNEGYIQTLDKKHLLLFITPAVPPTETKTNKDFIAALSGIITHTEKNLQNTVKVDYYGASPVSLGNSEQIRRDSMFTSFAALGVIIIMLLLYFRRLMVIFYILLPVAFGALFSLTILYFIKDQISAISLGAGSIILGIAINYSLHFFTHYRHERSVENVIKDLTLPMLIGCATTAAALLSLQFAKSEALHDFGLFAGFSLIGACLFSIIVLPHLLKPGKKETLRTEQDHASSFAEKVLSYPLDKNKTIVLIAFVLTIVFAFFSRHVSFESDMMKMNYQSPELNAAQERLESINKASLNTVYVVAKGKNLDDALKVSERIKAKLESLKADGAVERFSSPSTILVSDSLQKIRLQRWNSFWTEAKKDSLKKNLTEHGKKLKFKEEAFSDFENLINTSFKPVELSDLDTLKKLVVNDWITENKELTTVVTLVTTDPSRKEAIYKSFEGDSQVLVFDKRFLTNRFVEIIGSDFNLILLITALLVFGFMLLSHGRIELAIINFMPMFISWVWILGIMGLLGLKFNIINIIISTFIFGLGDDYSIFILDGLSHEYKYGKKNIESYKTSILLSALTNIIGIGVLIFAKHPALKSIAAITIIGMFTVLFISYIVQPLCYNFLILNRKKRQLLPYTATNLVITAIGFLVFIIGSLLLSVFGLILFYLIPAPLKKKKLLFHTLLMYICRFMIYMFVNVKKDIINPLKEDLSKPAVIICNHQSHIDLAMILMLNPKLVVFTNDWVWNSPFYGYIVRNADFYPASQGYENALDKIKRLTEDGYSALIFPEGTRSVTGEILRFHKGAFFLAEQLQLDILPMLLHGTGDCVTKGDFHFKEGQLSLKFLPRISPGDLKFGTGYKERSKNVRAYMRDEYEILRHQKETVHYFRPRLIKNYIFKGPVLEWYCRIKTKLEGDYENFEKCLPKKGKITDVGCGYGFLPLMLGFMSSERQILGVDYDAEKINIAANCISKNNNTRFVQADVTQFSFEASDAFIISDVLHYLPPQQQVDLIERCIEKLNPGGVMIVRDADADKKQRHLGTRYTEFFSTNSGFNQTKEGGLHFTSASLIKNTIEKYDFLEHRLIDDTKFTSNVTFVIQRKNYEHGKHI